MAHKLSAPLTKQFHLDRTDALFNVGDDDPTMVTIRQARQREAVLRQDIFGEVTRVLSAKVSDDSIKIAQRWTMEQLRRKEVQLTLIECNILNTDGTPLFKFRKNNHGESILDMTEIEFNEAWGRLEPVVAQEIHEKVLEINLDWGYPMGEES